SCRASPESVGPENSSRWLDDLLASPPPVAGSARRGAGSELTDAQSPSTCSEGLLGWSQKDLQSEFGVVADPPPSRFSPSRWSQGASQDYGFGGTHPRGDPGLGERDWSSKYGQGAGEGSSREWASRCSFGQEEIEVSSSQDQSEWAVGQPAQSDTQRQDTDVQQWEFRKEDSQGSYSRRDAELQDQEFGKRDSLASYSSKDASLQDWEFGKRESLGAYTSQDAVEPCQESGMKEHLGGYSSQDAEEQDREFEKRDSSLGIYSSRTSAQHQDQEFGTSAWMQDYGSDSSRTLSSQDRGFGMPALSPGFSPEEARQQDEEFEKKTLSGDDRLCEASRDADRPEEGESGCLFSPSTPKLQEGLLGQRDQNNWQDSDTTQEDAQLQGRPQTGGQSPADADLQDGEIGKLGWAGEFSLGVTSHSEEVFRPGRQDWSGELCMEATDRSRQFGIIGNDRMSGAGLSPSGEMGGSHFVPPGETASGPVDWTDQLGLRNLEVSSCVDSGGSSETRENTMGQMSWSDSLSLRDGDLASHLATGGSDEPRGMGVGEKDWTSSVGVRSRDLPGVEEVRGQSQTRESGVGQPDWSGMEAGEFLKTRERGVGQADWTPDLGLRNMAPAAGCSPAEPRELGVGQVDWSDNLGLRNLEVPCDLESGGGSRGCGVGQMDWGQDLGLRHMELSRALSESREHGVGRVSPVLEPGIRDSGGLSTGLETRDPLEVRELGVGETSGPETQGADHNLSFFETHPEDPEMETEGSGLGVSSSRCLARSPPSGSQGLLEEMLAASNSKAATGQESAVLGLRVPLEEEGATAGAGQRESSEPSREPLPSWRPQPDGEASRMEEVDGTWDLAGAGQSERGPAPAPRRSSQGPLPSCPSEDFSFIEDTEVLDSAIYRSRANLGRKRGHRAPAIRPGGTLGLSELADSDARLFQDSTEPRSSRVPSSDEEVVEEPQSRRTRMSLGTKGLKVNLFPGLSPSALKAKLRSRNRSAEEGEVAESKSSQKESAVQRSKSCKVPGLGKPLALPPKPEKSSGSEGSSPNWLQALKLKKKRV
uniref:Tankyrase 1-binding protein C-terminal domain-containing protein n=1 Tax=Jaculus jaculus TaxID=51337 RepID=A0A8C5LAC5_JACJA